MSIRICVLLSVVLLLTALAASADKKKNLLPATVLKARTVLGLIDPDAGISVSDPAANKTARDDVEKAIMNGGRLLPVLDGQNPDLIIVVSSATSEHLLGLLGSSAIPPSSSLLAFAFNWGHFPPPALPASSVLLASRHLIRLGLALAGYRLIVSYDHR